MNLSIYLKSYQPNIDESLEMEEDYLGMRLYDLTIYSICNELIIFKNELNISLHRATIL